VVSRAVESVSDEDLIPEEEAIVTVSGGGYIKRLPPGTFKVQAARRKRIDRIRSGRRGFSLTLFSANNARQRVVLYDHGRAFQTKVYEIPQATRTSKGGAIQNFLELPSNENVSAIVSIREGRQSGR